MESSVYSSTCLTLCPQDRIEELRASKTQYGNMLREARSMYARFEALLSTHRNIRAQFQVIILLTNLLIGSHIFELPFTSVTMHSGIIASSMSNI